MSLNVSSKRVSLTTVFNSVGITVPVVTSRLPEQMPHGAGPPTSVLVRGSLVMELARPVVGGSARGSGRDTALELTRTVHVSGSARGSGEARCWTGADPNSACIGQRAGLRVRHGAASVRVWRRSPFI